MWGSASGHCCIKVLAAGLAWPAALIETSIELGTNGSIIGVSSGEAMLIVCDLLTSAVWACSLRSCYFFTNNAEPEKL